MNYFTHSSAVTENEHELDIKLQRINSLRFGVAFKKDFISAKWDTQNQRHIWLAKSVLHPLYPKSSDRLNIRDIIHAKQLF